MQTCTEPGCDRPALKSGRCGDHGRRRKSDAAMEGDALQLTVPADVAAWLRQRPEGPAAFVEAAVRQAMQGGQEARIAAALREVLQEHHRRQDVELAGTLARTVSSLLAGPSPSGPAAPPPVPPGPDCQPLLDQIKARDPQAAARAARLTRYPQLVEAVARELVSIERAESMAEEADARKR